MGPTKSVPAALHSELSEYASLLRAIRTNSTLDIVPQLSRPTPVYDDSDVESQESFESEEGGNPGYREPPESQVTSSRPAKSAKGKGKAKGPAKKIKKPRRKGDDTWTRWPLLQEHCPIPEWGLDEEVKTIAEQCSRSRRPSSPVAGPSNRDSTPQPNSEDGDEFDQPNLSAAHLSGLTSDAASKLSAVLSLLALHRPNVTYTKHGRVDHMGWEDVMEIVGVAGIFEPEVVEDVKKRMEVIFGPSQSQVVHRMQVLAASKRVLAAAETSFGEEISSLVGPPPEAKSHRAKKRKRMISGSRDAAVATAVQLIADPLILLGKDDRAIVMDDPP